MSDRICQFFLRGRCQRTNCEFRHPADRVPPPTCSNASTVPPGVCRFFLKGHCKFGTSCRFKHEDLAPAVSTDAEAAPVSSVSEEPSNESEEVVEQKEKAATGFESDEEAILDKDNESDDSVASGFTEGTSKKPVDNAPEEIPVRKQQTLTTTPEEKEMAKSNFMDTSTFLAATTSETVVQQSGTPLLTRRAPKARDTLTSADTPDDNADEESACNAPLEEDQTKKKKEIRRDSKGFERFEDYFSDSEMEASVSLQEEPAQPEPEKQPSDKEGASAHEEESEPAEQTVFEGSLQLQESEESLNLSEEKPARGPPKKDEATKSMSVEEGDTSKDNTAADKKAVNVADLSKDWDEEAAGDKSDGEKEQNKEEQSNGGEAEETIENIESFIQDEPTASEPLSSTPLAAPKAGSKVRQQKIPASGKKEGWVTFIFGEDGKQIEEEKHKKSVYDLDPDEENAITETAPFSSKPAKAAAVKTGGKKKDSLAKKEGVTKIGNNTYYYTGPKQSTDEDDLDDDDDEDEDDNDAEDEDYDQSTNEGEEEDHSKPNITTTPSRRGRSYAHGRRKHNTNYVYGAKSTAAKTRRCGECEGCNREDCGECPACLDKPKFGGRGAKKQACVYRVCSWKNPGGKRGGRGRGGGTPGSASSRGRGKMSMGPSKLEAANESSLAEEDTPTPTSTPTPTPTPAAAAAASAAATTTAIATLTPTISVMSVKKRGGRRSISVISPATVKRPDDKDLPQFDPKQFKPGYVPPVVKKGSEEYHIVVTGVKDTGLCGKYWADVESLPPKRRRTTISQGPDSAPQTPSPSPSLTKTRKSSVSSTEELAMETMEGSKPSDDGQKDDENSTEETEETSSTSASRKRAQSRHAKRKATDEPALSPDKKRPSGKKGSNGVHADDSSGGGGDDNSYSDNDRQEQKRTQPESQSIALGQNRSVSCLADTSTQREVVVECFAPYDEHRWVNIGKERDNMAPDAVQYARALRPPYHLLSFLRIKGHSTKGMSCTDKNTMVFVVLKGEITVVLHTTQFNAKKGDSFYIPPKNNYNLINNKATESELSLIQFQYDGPLPTVSAASQSGAPKAATK